MGIIMFLPYDPWKKNEIMHVEFLVKYLHKLRIPWILTITVIIFNNYVSQVLYLCHFGNIQ